MLEHRGGHITITEDAVKAVVNSLYHSRDMLRLLLDRGSDKISITKEILNAVARHMDTDIMELLLHRRGHQVNITGDVLMAAASNLMDGKGV